MYILVQIGSVTYGTISIDNMFFLLFAINLHNYLKLKEVNKLYQQFWRVTFFKPLIATKERYFKNKTCYQKSTSLYVCITRNPTLTQRSEPRWFMSLSRGAAEIAPDSCGSCINTASLFAGGTISNAKIWVKLTHVMKLTRTIRAVDSSTGHC